MYNLSHPNASRPKLKATDFPIQRASYRLPPIIHPRIPPEFPHFPKRGPAKSALARARACPSNSSFFVRLTKECPFRADKEDSEWRARGHNALASSRHGSDLKRRASTKIEVKKEFGSCVPRRSGR